jgi:hypothetical protein
MNTDIKKLVSDYFNGPLKKQSTYPFIEEALDTALILVTGSYSFGMFTETSDLDIEFIIPDALHTAFVKKAGGVKNLWVHDENHQPLVDIKIRPLGWLQNRLSGTDPEVLWIYQHAIRIQDRDLYFSELLANATEKFHSIYVDLLIKSYKDFRTGITIPASRESLGKTIMMVKAIEAALALPFLSQKQPYPYPKWQSIWLKSRCKEGDNITSLCEQWLVGEPVYEQLREVINSVMIESGHSDLVKNFWRKV